MKVRVTSDYDVPDQAAYKIAADFLDWLDSTGFLVSNANSQELDSMSYDDLAKKWVAYETGEKYHDA